MMMERAEDEAPQTPPAQISWPPHMPDPSRYSSTTFYNIPDFPAALTSSPFTPAPPLPPSSHQQLFSQRLGLLHQPQDIHDPLLQLHPLRCPSFTASALDARMQAPPPPQSQHHQPPPPMAQAPAVQRTDQAPEPFSATQDGRIYRLKVIQEPIRARMCGFGDKDRRPITPPPCVLLEVLDEKTRMPVDVNELDPTYFVMSVDLWSPDGLSEVNLVRHSATSPSISATTQSSYPPQPLPPTPFAYGQPMTLQQGGSGSYGYPAPGGAASQVGGPPHDPYAQHQQQTQYAANYDPGRYYQTSSAPMTPTHPYGPPQNGGPPPQQGQLISPTQPVMITQDPRSAPTGMFTRNLIGSLSVSAFKLTDTHDQLGIWFILQDLSVRTEGMFRLKFSFVNVGVTGQNHSQLNMGSAPVLATCFSSTFQVFSAKKFPGVIESTQLSKCFAGQGIKIPIRKDGNGRVNDDDD